jgi:HEAT repeat protein
MGKSARSKQTSNSGKARLIGGIGASVLVLGLMIYWFMRPTPDSVLNAATLTPKQIRYVATELLVHEDVKLRARASEKLLSLGEAAVPVLKEVCLNFSDNRVREAVLKILVTISPTGSADIVGRLAGDTDPKVRRMAVLAAAGLPSAQRLPIMQKALADPDTTVRWAAMDSMATRQTADNIPALNQALQDSDITVRRHAAHTLRTMTGRDYSSQVNAPK